jgi:Zn-dependent metalloprotease
MHWRFKFALLFALAALLSSLAPNLSSTPALAAPVRSDDQLLAELRQITGGKLRIARHAETGKLRLAATDVQHTVPHAAGLSAVASSEQVARAFLQRYGSLFGVADQAQELMVMRETAAGGGAFVRFQQLHAGVPVLGGEIIVQLSGSRGIVSASGELLPDIRQRTVPAIAAADAQQRARAHVAKSAGVAPSQLLVNTPELWLYNPSLLGGPGLRQTSLTWRLEVSNTALPEPIRALVLIDAQSGALALSFNQIADAKNRFVCDDNNVPDTDANENNNCDQPGEHVRIEGNPATGNADVDQAYDYSGDTYDYYFNNFGRDSIDGAGMPLVSLVRYCPQGTTPGLDCPWQNASWNGVQMTYGEGFAAADDVVGHELTHGVTEFSSNLFYYYQSGAINESLSDVFGELIDQGNNGGTDTPAVRWELGEDVPGFGTFRDMQDPPRFGDPDRTGSPLYYGSPGDNGGVHENSGVNNKAAFLLTDGGSFNGYTISGLGPVKTSQLYYRVNTTLLTSGSDYQDLGDALKLACASLTGSFGITAADCAEVDKVVRATEMDTPPANALALDARVCSAGQTVNNSFFDDLETPASGKWTTAPVSGTVDEWYYPVPASPSPIDDYYNGSYATSGKQNFWGYDYNGLADYAIRMTNDVVVPAGAFMHFRHAYDFEYDPFSGQAFDGGVVEYSTNGGTSWTDAGPLFEVNGYDATIPAASDNPLAGREAFSGISKGYLSSRLNLSTLAGQSVRFRFRIGTDSFVPFSPINLGWFIDDVRIYTCSGTAVNTPPTLLANRKAVVNQQDQASAVVGNVFDEQDVAETLSVAVTGAPAGIQVSVANRNGEVVATVAPDCATPPGVYNLTLTVTDSGGLTDTAAIQVVVYPYQQRIKDGGFEGGTPNPVWGEVSQLFGTPLCGPGLCGTVPGVAEPHTGDWWIWFGGVPAAETAAVTQTLGLPPDATTLEFYLWVGSHSGNGSSDYMQVLIDNTEVFSVTDDSTAYDAGYTLVSVPVAAFAGAERTLSILYHNDSPSSMNTISINVDDVSLTAATNVCAVVPAVGMGSARQSVAEVGGTVNLTVTLSVTALVTVEVGYAADGGTATPGFDYTLAPGTLTFAPGETSKTIPVTIKADSAPEPDETVVVKLSGQRNATLGASSATLTIVDARKILLPIAAR